MDGNNHSKWEKKNVSFSNSKNEEKNTHDEKKTQRQVNRVPTNDHKIKRFKIIMSISCVNGAFDAVKFEIKSKWATFSSGRDRENKSQITLSYLIVMAAYR